MTTGKGEKHTRRTQTHNFSSSHRTLSVAEFQRRIPRASKLFFLKTGWSLPFYQQQAHSRPRGKDKALALTVSLERSRSCTCLEVNTNTKVSIPQDPRLGGGNRDGHACAEDTGPVWGSCPKEVATAEPLTSGSQRNSLPNEKPLIDKAHTGTRPAGTHACTQVTNGDPGFTQWPQLCRQGCESTNTLLNLPTSIYVWSARVEVQQYWPPLSVCRRLLRPPHHAAFPQRPSLPALLCLIAVSGLPTKCILESLPNSEPRRACELAMRHWGAGSELSLDTVSIHAQGLWGHSDPGFLVEPISKYPARKQCAFKRSLWSRNSRCACLAPPEGRHGGDRPL